MKAILLTAVLAASLSAQADGFKCETESGLNIQVFNHTSPAMGTRTGSVMVVSDSNVQYGNKTIAKFTSQKSTLTSKNLRYTAKVDLRVSESNRKGELIAGTKLGYVSQILLDVAFTYSSPISHGSEVPAVLTVVKRNGTYTQEAAICARYLKN
jgi:hypothetical protein